MSTRAAPAKSTRAAPARRGSALKAAVLALLLLLAGGGATAGVIFATHHTVQYRTHVVIRRVPVPVIRYRTRTVTVTGVACWEHDGGVELSPAGTGPRVRATCREAYVSPASSGLVKFIAPDGAAVTYARAASGSSASRGLSPGAAHIVVVGCHLPCAAVPRDGRVGGLRTHR